VTILDFITILLALFLIAYLLFLFRIIVDFMRDETLSGGSKALWMIALIFVPVLSALAYLAVRGEGMAERRRASRMAVVTGHGRTDGSPL
jgi:ABC-type multidrug transport system permease subunit